MQRRIHLVLLFLLLFPCVALAQTGDRLKADMGLTQMKPMYPLPGSEITDTRPMITIDLSGLETPVSPSTVIMLVNGSDVTQKADINPSYILFQPITDLPPGSYEVRVTAQNVNGQAVEPLGWKFVIKGAAPSRQAEDGDRTTGNLNISNDFVFADYSPQNAFDITSIFEEKEGSKLNVDFNFTNISEGRTVIGSYNRKTRSYTGQSQDKWRYYYLNTHFDAVAGNYWLDLSDLTVAGTEMLGVKIDKRDGPWKFQFFSGRSQDPSTSGGFKQVTSGMRGDYEWSQRSRTLVTLLSAYELDRGETTATNVPARDDIISVRHEVDASNNVSATLEVAHNIRKPQTGGASRNDAYKFLITGVANAVSGEIEVYNIPRDFVPVAEGSSRTLNSNREGFRAQADYSVTEWLDTGVEYEEYDADASLSTAAESVRYGNGYVTISTDVMPALTFRRSKLTSSQGTTSESDSVSMFLLAPATFVFPAARLNVSWQDVDFTAPALSTNSRVWLFSVNTPLTSTLDLSAYYSTSDLTTSLTATATNQKNMSLGLNWRIIPDRLVWSGKYELLKNTGASSDNRKKQVLSSFNYQTTQDYALTLSTDFVSYSDAVNPAFTYDQNIWRTGVEWDF